VLLAVLRVRFGDWHETNKMRVVIAFAAIITGAGLLSWQDYYGQFAPLFSGAVVLLAAQRSERGLLGSFFGGHFLAASPIHFISITGSVSSLPMKWRKHSDGASIGP